MGSTTERREVKMDVTDALCLGSAADRVGTAVGRCVAKRSLTSRGGHTTTTTTTIAATKPQPRRRPAVRVDAKGRLRIPTLWESLWGNASSSTAALRGGDQRGGDHAKYADSISAQDDAIYSQAEKAGAGATTVKEEGEGVIDNAEGAELENAYLKKLESWQSWNPPRVTRTSILLTGLHKKLGLTVEEVLEKVNGDTNALTDMSRQSLKNNVLRLKCKEIEKDKNLTEEQRRKLLTRYKEEVAFTTTATTHEEQKRALRELVLSRKGTANTISQEQALRSLSELGEHAVSHLYSSFVKQGLIVDKSQRDVQGVAGYEMMMMERASRDGAESSQCQAQHAPQDHAEQSRASQELSLEADGSHGGAGIEAYYRSIPRSRCQRGMRDTREAGDNTTREGRECRSCTFFSFW